MSAEYWNTWCTTKGVRELIVSGYFLGNFLCGYALLNNFFFHSLCNEWPAGDDHGFDTGLANNSVLNVSTRMGQEMRGEVCPGLPP